MISMNDWTIEPLLQSTIALRSGVCQLAGETASCGYRSPMLVRRPATDYFPRVTLQSSGIVVSFGRRLNPVPVMIYWRQTYDQ